MVGCASMASGNPFFDPPQAEEPTEICEIVNDPTPTALKPNGTVSNSVRELLECPVCLNAMYPPIHQVVFIFMVHYLIREIAHGCNSSTRVNCGCTLIYQCNCIFYSDLLNSALCLLILCFMLQYPVISN